MVRGAIVVVGEARRCPVVAVKGASEDAKRIRSVGIS